MARTSLATRNLLITGASRGIGRATAIAAGERGWSVVVNYRRGRTMAMSAVEDVHGAGGKAVAIQADIAEEADVMRLFDAAEAEFGRLDVVVLNAGITAPITPLADADLARLQRIVQVNVLGPLLCAREAARRLPRPDTEVAAAIVLVSSMAARLGSPHEYVDYAATKGALDTLTIGLSRELAAHNVRVNAVRPGLIDTDIHTDSGQPDRAERLGKSTPMGRAGRPEEVAEAILWLASEAASYTTGSVVDVAGGR